MTPDQSWAKPARVRTSPGMRESLESCHLSKASFQRICYPEVTILFQYRPKFQQKELCLLPVPPCSRLELRSMRNGMISMLFSNPGSLSSGNRPQGSALGTRLLEVKQRKRLSPPRESTWNFEATPVRQVRPHCSKAIAAVPEREPTPSLIRSLSGFVNKVPPLNILVNWRRVNHNMF